MDKQRVWSKPLPQTGHPSRFFKDPVVVDMIAQSENQTPLTTTEDGPHTINIAASVITKARFKRLSQFLLSWWPRLYWFGVRRGWFVKRIQMPAGTIAGLQDGTYYVYAEYPGTDRVCYGVTTSPIEAVGSKVNKLILGRITTLKTSQSTDPTCGDGIPFKQKDSGQAIS